MRSRHGSWLMANGDGGWFRPLTIAISRQPLQHFSFVRSVRLQADHHGPAKAGHYVLLKKRSKAWPR
jgi:hypothetical protein